MVLSKQLLLKSIKLENNERFLFEILFTFIPYYYYEVIIRNVIVIEFFLLCLLFYVLYEIKNFNVVNVLIGILVYLNPTYILIFILVF